MPTFHPRNAVATSFWGVPRTTQDADCLVAVPAIAYQRLADALNATGFVMERSPDPQHVTVEALLQQVREDKYMTLACRATSVEMFIPVVPLQHAKTAGRELDELIATYEADRPASKRKGEEKVPATCQPPKMEKLASCPVVEAGIIF